jgi:RNA polymerase sigma-70 factor (ECF subfamily)
MLLAPTGGLSRGGAWPVPNPSFQATRWSIVRGAGAEDPAVRAAAFERLCAQYWYPLFAYLRRGGRSPEDAADLVQGLFTQLLSGDGLERLVEGAGRFRSWILTALVNHARDVRDRDQAQKRGGGRPVIPIDPVEGERRLALQGAPEEDPEVAFERAWALEVLGAARELLEREMRASGRGRLFEALAASLGAAGEAPPREELAAELGLSAVALRVALHRLRERYRQLVVAVLRDSLDGRADPGEELRLLARALGGEGSESAKFL